MNRTITFLSLVMIFLFAACQQQGAKPESQQVGILEKVDPFIGTADHGHVYPGATVPFGMVQLSPDNGTQGWDWCSGYNYADSMIVGFSHMHLSGTGIGDLADISVMPATGTINLDKAVESHKEEDFASRFSHEDEEASPGYYRVFLEKPSVDAELTATRRTGFHRYRFRGGDTPSIILNLAFAINWDAPVDCQIRIDGNTVTGHRFSRGWARDQRVFYALEFSETITRFEVVADGDQVEGNEARGTRIKARLYFEDNNGEPILMKAGLSSAGEEAAVKAIAQENPGWDFEDIRQQAEAQWTSELNKIRISARDPELEKVFYTAFYHSMLAPVTYSDINGAYKAADSTVHQREFTRYDIFSLWDTFRAANPLFTITQPDRVNDMIRSMLAHYEEYGLLPVWSLHGNETNTMTGYHAIPVITDAYFKGFRDYDVEKAYAAMKKSAMQDIRGVKFLKEYDYIPHDLEGQSVTKTLEYAYDDWCIAQMAKELGYEEDHTYFSQRAMNYRNLFDPSTGFMRAKLSDGSWKEPFDPKYSSHDFAVAEYTEGNAWQHSWFVPHDIRGLVELHGGDASFVRMLDSLFNEDSEIKGENASADISGLIGQYAHGNEPSHHIAYMYLYAGAPWKTQERTREIMGMMYTAEPSGLCGNEDCGQMSAWYVFGALGMYPTNPAQGIYTLGSPLFSEAEIRIGDKVFRIIAENVSASNKYIAGVRLNGEEMERLYITHKELKEGGELVLTMTDQPVRDFAVVPAHRPPAQISKSN